MPLQAITMLLGLALIAGGAVFLVINRTRSARGAVTIGDYKIEGPVGFAMIVLGALLFMFQIGHQQPPVLSSEPPASAPLSQSSLPLAQATSSNTQPTLSAVPEQNCVNNKTTGQNAPIVCGPNSVVTIK